MYWAPRAQNEFEQLFGFKMKDRDLNWWRPQIDVKQSGNDVVIKAELPGMKKEDIRLEFDPSGTLTISGEKFQQKKDENETYYRSERRYGRFSRSIAVPEGVKERYIRAKFENGTLEVVLGTPPGREEPKKINLC